MATVRARIADYNDPDKVECWGSSQPQSAPAAPSNVNYQVVSNGAGIGVSWDDNSTNEAGFDVAYWPQGDLSSQRHLLVPPNQTFISSGWLLKYNQNGLLQSGQTVCFQVSSYNSTGASTPVSAVTTPCISIP